MAIFVDGQQVNIPLEQLIAEGEELMRQENIPPSKLFDMKLFAASVAVAKYDQAHQEWVEAEKLQRSRWKFHEGREGAKELAARLNYNVMHDVEIDPHYDHDIDQRYKDLGI
jgi:hypothetical protein